MNDICISRMYIDYHEDCQVMVMHVTAHTNNQPGPREDMYLPLPKST